jgi:hypothetical protein
MARVDAGGPGAGTGVGRRAVLAGATGTLALAGCAPGAVVPAGAGAPAASLGVVAPAAPSLAATAAGATSMVKVTVEVQKALLVEQLHAYLSDFRGRPSERNHPVVQAVSDPRGLGISPALLEALVLEGDLSPEDVDAFVSGMLDNYENVNLIVH